jgi:hypothetical protein
MADGPIPASAALNRQARFLAVMLFSGVAAAAAIAAVTLRCDRRHAGRVSGNLARIETPHYDQRSVEERLFKGGRKK